MMEELKGNFPPGVDYRIAYDTTIFARESIRAVVTTLFEAVLLVVLVVIVFLQSWRASIIPLLAVPVSLIGTLAVMQVSGGSQSFNAVNQMRVLGRWMRMVTIPNQSSVAKAFLEFGDDDRMKPSSYYERVVDVMEELVKFTLLTRDCANYLVDRYSERRESAEELSKRVNQRSI